MSGYILAFEVVSQTGSIACVADDGSCFDHRPIGHRRFAQDLVPLLDDCLRCHGKPAALAVAVGPGSFTGLRVSVIAARSIAWLDDLPIHPVDSLAARAAQEGPGCWWVLQALKRDTTFQAAYRVDDDGGIELVSPLHPQLDSNRPDLSALPADAIAIGPALADKPALLADWDDSRARGSVDHLDARGVAAACSSHPAVAWREVLPAYHQASAPELQRKAAS